MFKKLLLAGAFVIAGPVAALAATINGQIDIVGLVNIPGSDFTIGGNVDLLNPGTVLQATGDFAPYITPPVSATLTDVDFSLPGTIWEVAGFTFAATDFFGILNGTEKAFHANGEISGNGFDVTKGVLSFTAQDGNALVAFSTTTTAVPLPASGILLLGGLGGLIAAKRRKKA